MTVIMFLLAFVVIATAVIYLVGVSNQDAPAEDDEAIDDTPKLRTLTDAEQEAYRQAEEAFDWRTCNAITNGTYDGKLPTYDGTYWSDLYPHLYRTNIADIDYQRAISSLASVTFDALLIPDTHDANAIKIVTANDNTHVGYIPTFETSGVRAWVSNRFPARCRAHIDAHEDLDDDCRDIIRLEGIINIPRSNVLPKQ